MLHWAGLYDAVVWLFMLGRERALLFDGPLNARSVLLTITPATLGLEPGSYMLRLTGGEVFAVRRFSVVR